MLLYKSSKGENMKFYLYDKEIDSIKFCDYIEVTTKEDNKYIYNITWDKTEHFCLQLDDEPLIREITIKDSKLIIYYTDGDLDVLNEEVTSIDIYCLNYRRRCLIEGHLLKYDTNMAKKFNLDESQACLTVGYSGKNKRRTLKKEDTIKD